MPLLGMQLNWIIVYNLSVEWSQKLDSILMSSLDDLMPILWKAPDKRISNLLFLQPCKIFKFQSM